MTQTELTYKFIKDRIIDGTFKPAQKLIESQLSETIGVSRNTIKKALLMLERENFVVIERNKGAIIKAYTLDEILNYLEIREVLEGIVARNATKNITHDDIEVLDVILAEMKIFLQNNKFAEYSSRNQDFHEIIYNASTNVQAVDLIKGIKTQLNKYQFRTILVPGRNDESYQEHERILNGIKARNEIEVEAAIVNHITNVRKTIERNYSILV